MTYAIIIHDPQLQEQRTQRFAEGPNRISQIIAGKRNVTADTALRLGRYFGMSAEFWMNLQKTYELDLARRDLGPAIEAIPSRGEAEASARP